ncbi:MAG: LCP family protein [Bifidobacteriaceae bacterium]|nr:LCP family protein [Bifidobacteriaceae bacterium]
MAATVGIVLLALTLAVSVDAAVLVLRVDRFPIPATTSAAPGETWVLVGTDSREHRPPGRDIYYDGGLPGAIGERADIILVLRLEADGSTQVVSVPRDMVLPRTVDGGHERVAVALEQGEAELVHALCAGLGIPTDHLVKVTLRGFVEAVDALGGLTLDFEHSTRDYYSFLEPTGAGSQTLDGEAALAFVRSRHPEYLIDGKWRETGLDEGNAYRASNAATTVAALQRSAQDALSDPIRLQRAAWAVSGGFQVDEQTSLWSLAQLARASAGANMITLPGATTGSELALLADQTTYDAVSAAGYTPGSCQVVP